MLYVNLFKTHSTGKVESSLVKHHLLVFHVCLHTLQIVFAQNWLGKFANQIHTYILVCMFVCLTLTSRLEAYYGEPHARIHCLVLYDH